jgi:hypothetical protein
MPELANFYVKEDRISEVRKIIPVRPALKTSKIRPDPDPQVTAVLLTQLLEDAGELAGGRLGLLLRVGARARDLPGGPNGGRGVGVPQLHCHHPVLTP